MVENDVDLMCSSSSDEDCGLVDVKSVHFLFFAVLRLSDGLCLNAGGAGVPMDIWKRILKECDTRTKMRLMGTSKFFREMLDTDEYWHEIVVEELPRLRDNIYMSQNEFQDLDTYNPNNADDVADKTRFGLSPKGWKDTIRLYGTFPEVLFGKRQGFWKDIFDLKNTVEHPWISFILFTLTWISLMLFLFFFFFAIFYATNFIRGPVFDKLADDGHVSNLLTNKVTRSDRDDMWLGIIISAASVAGFFVMLYFLCKDLDTFVNGDYHTFNIRNRLVDGPVTKPYPERSIKENRTTYDVLFREAAATENITQKFTEDGRLITNSDTILFSLLFYFIMFFGGMFLMNIQYGFWMSCPGDFCFTLIMFIISLVGIILAWVLFSVKLCCMQSVKGG
eukprot:MONOS_327.1-p1 / transcript=MONOS_327.1 / gene=MONOS_327 / organism=Monocercomonoides_exilis_PA203 / gene_product=unspecified product / transcript_product=unspecified product / location=Mono_scaffold00005:167376-168864(+) / protein_length=391 / sequence_SO=supercontig / SO=protein_coding / is_pseudo=false